jgi:putative transposase
VAQADYGIDAKYLIPDGLWAEMVRLLPVPKAKKKAGRPRANDRRMMTAILYVLRTGIQWEALPHSLSPHSTAHDRFQEWRAAGFFERLWQEGLYAYDEEVGIDWTWQAMDGVMTKAPLGGEQTGPNPTDRAKRGVKRSVLTDGHGVPLGIAVDGANRPDMKMVEATLESIPIEQPVPTPDSPQHLCLDAGYDYDAVRDTIEEWGYTAHIRSRTQEAQDKAHVPGYRARRWVVERTHSWMNRFRRLLIRWEKNTANYLALLHLACACIAFRAAGFFG